MKKFLVLAVLALSFFVGKNVLASNTVSPDYYAFPQDRITITLDDAVAWATYQPNDGLNASDEMIQEYTESRSVCVGEWNGTNPAGYDGANCIGGMVDADLDLRPYNFPAPYDLHILFFSAGYDIGCDYSTYTLALANCGAYILQDETIRYFMAVDTLNSIGTVVISTGRDVASNIFTTYWPYFMVLSMLAVVVIFFIRLIRRL